MPMKLETIIGRRLQQMRKSQGLSQEALANKADLHPTYIGRIERGEVSPTINVLDKIANALNFPLDKLLSFSSEDKTELFETITLFQNVSPQYLELITYIQQQNS